MNTRTFSNLPPKRRATATFAGGCFWCTEAIFRRLKGVVRVIPGYTGGNVPNPTYEQVCSGNTGHAEAVQIAYNPAVISFETLLNVFFHVHDPTTPDRQGADVGPQYRSAVFYRDNAQKNAAEDMIVKLEQTGNYRKIVTGILPYTGFYPAEDYHREYYEKNSHAPYCQVVIDPKITKLMTDYRGLLKNNYTQ